MSTYLLGIDVSTTATKALLIDDAGAVIAVAATDTRSSAATALDRAGRRPILARRRPECPRRPGEDRHQPW